MSSQSWTAVDQYLTDTLIPNDPILEQVLRTNEAAGLPAYDVSPLQGKFLFLLAKLCNARRILEIGTLGGYSTIWLARALPPGGKLVTLEINAGNARVARENIERAGLGNVVDVRVGPALRTLADMALEVQGEGRFDVVFIDADKRNNVGYLEWALKFSHKGTLIVADNVVRAGEVVNGESEDESVKGMRMFLDMLMAEKGVDATALQTVGTKGWDGFVMALVVEDIENIDDS
jgi:predicted O-methyltransferase YrrM